MFHNKKKTWHVYKGLTAVFHNKIHFGEVYKTAKKVLKLFNVTVIPAIIAVRKINEELNCT